MAKEKRQETLRLSGAFRDSDGVDFPQTSRANKRRSPPSVKWRLIKANLLGGAATARKHVTVNSKK